MLNPGNSTSSTPLSSHTSRQESHYLLANYPSSCMSGTRSSPKFWRGSKCSKRLGCGRSSRSPTWSTTTTTELSRSSLRCAVDYHLRHPLANKFPNLDSTPSSISRAITFSSPTRQSITFTDHVPRSKLRSVMLTYPPKATRISLAITTVHSAHVGYPVPCSSFIAPYTYNVTPRRHPMPCNANVTFSVWICWCRLVREPLGPDIRASFSWIQRREGSQDGSAASTSLNIKYVFITYSQVIAAIYKVREVRANKS